MDAESIDEQSGSYHHDDDYHHNPATATDGFFPAEDNAAGIARSVPHAPSSQPNKDNPILWNTERTSDVSSIILNNHGAAIQHPQLSSLNVHDSSTIQQDLALVPVEDTGGVALNDSKCAPCSNILERPNQGLNAEEYKGRSSIAGHQDPSGQTAYPQQSYLVNPLANNTNDGEKLSPQHRIIGESMLPLAAVIVMPMPHPFDPSLPTAPLPPLQVKPLSSPPQTQKESQTWEPMLQRLKSFKSKHHHTAVPKRYTDDPKLGTWVETNRVQFRKLWVETGKSKEFLISSPDPTIYVTPNKRLSEERLKKLQDVGFSWSVRNAKKVSADSAGRKKRTRDVGDGDTVTILDGEVVDGKGKHTEVSKRRKRNDALWNDMYGRLVQYKNENGHCLIQVDNDPKLAKWVNTQRTLYSKHYSRKDTELNHSQGASSTEVHEEICSKDGMQLIGDTKKSDTNDGPSSAHAFEAPPPSDNQTLDDSAQLDSKSLCSEQHPSHHANITTQTKTTTDREDEVTNTTSALADQISTTFPGELSLDSARETSSRPAEKKPSIRLTQDRKERLDEIGFVWSLRSMKNEEHWEEMFTELLQYKEKHGNCTVPTRCDNKKLAKWIETTRSEYAKLKSINDPSTGLTRLIPSSKLPASKINRLEEVGFEWRIKGKTKRKPAVGVTERLIHASVIESSNTPANRVSTEQSARKEARHENKQQWNNMFGALEGYKSKYGDTKVPKRYKDDKQLGIWVDTQRSQYKKLQQKIANGETNAKSNRLTEDRIQRLNEVGFVWSIRDDWQTHYNELVKYKSLHAHCNVPARYTLNNRLGIWVTSQRQQFKLRKQGKPDTQTKRSISLTEERIKLLDDIGFSWSLRSNATIAENWQENFGQLCTFKAQFGHCNVPPKYEPNRSLGAWCGSQRSSYRQYTKAKSSGQSIGNIAITEDRIGKLEEIGFDWTNRKDEAIWKKFLEDIRAFKVTYGIDCPVPFDFKENPCLGTFAQAQRAQRVLYDQGKSSSLDASKIAELDSLGFCWNDRETFEQEFRNIDDVFDHEMREALELKPSATDTDTDAHLNAFYPPMTYEDQHRLPIDHNPRLCDHNEADTPIQVTNPCDSEQYIISHPGGEGNFEATEMTDNIPVDSCIIDGLPENDQPQQHTIDFHEHIQAEDESIDSNSQREFE